MLVNEKFCFGPSQVSKWRRPGGNGIQEREKARISHLGPCIHMELKATSLYEHAKGVCESA